MLKLPTEAPSYMRDFARELQALEDAQDIRLGNLEAKAKAYVAPAPKLDARMPWTTLAIAAATTLPAINRAYYINCTSAADFTLGAAQLGGWVFLCNGGTQTLTVKDGGTTLCTLPQNTCTFIRCFATSAYAAQWPTKAATWKLDGTLNLGFLTASRLVATDASGNLASNASLVSTGVVYATGTGAVVSAATLTYADPLLTAFSNSHGATSTAAFALSNTTAATSGNQKWSPALDWIGQGFGTGLPGASIPVIFRAECVPVQGGGAPTGVFTLSSKIGAGSFTSRLTLTTAGVLTTASNLATSPTLGSGYTTGAGGTVTQATSKATGVTLNKVCGQITMNNATLNAATSVSFTLTNSAIAAADSVVVNIQSAATADSYIVMVTAVAAGSCRIQVYNFSGSNLGEALVLNFSVRKGVTA